MSFRSGSKSKENLESWETLLRKTLSKDGFLNFVKPADNPIHWIHLLDPFDHQTSVKTSGESRATSYMDLSGWPLIPFSKVQMLKCEKCCMEFCSPVNHRRHLRMIHRRGTATEKENARSQRQQLTAFWDALSAEEAVKIVDVKNLILEELAGEKIAKALSKLLQQPALLALPHVYVKSGAMLLELVQRSLSKQPLPSSELFKIFDGSSEKTFPSFGLDVIHRYIFEGGAGKVGLEAKNLVSSLGLLVELNLVKAFIKSKDEEAQRCQTALVEEEEAFQRKQAQLQEKRRLKKARQKDVKEKEQKLIESAKAFLSAVNDSSGEEEPGDANSGSGYEVQSKPSPTDSVNPYHTLAGEEGDTDPHTSVHVMSAEEPKDDGQLMLSEGSEGYHLYAEAVPILEASDSRESARLNSPGVSVNVAGSEHETMECDAKDLLNEAVTQGAMGSGKFSFKEKHQYLALQSPKTQDLRAPFEKFTWKEKALVHSMKEITELAGTDGCSEDSPTNRVVSYQNRQFAGKFQRARKYPMAAPSRTTVWTKKAAMGSEPPVEDVSNSARSVEVNQAKSEAAVIDTSQGSIATTHLSPFSSTCSYGFSEQPSVLSVVDGAALSLETHASGLGHGTQLDHVGDPLSPVSPSLVGSLVIGSVCVSFTECIARQDREDLQLNSLEEAVRAKNSGALESDSAESGLSSGKAEESLRALNENEATSCLPHNEPERTGKASKFPLQVDLEEKENHEHPLHVVSELKSGRPVNGQAGFRGGRVKVWRPIVSTSSHEPNDGVDRTASTNLNSVGNQRSQSPLVDLDKPINASSHQSKDMVDSTVPENLNAVADQRNHVRIDDLDQPNKLRLMGLEGQSISENDSNSLSHMPTLKERLKGAEEPCISVSTFEAVRGLLSKRWSDVVKALDTVVLTLEDEEGECESKELCEDIVGAEDLVNLPLQANEEALNRSVNVKTVHGLWKDGCSGSAMVTNRHLSGKNCNFHASPRFTHYRYVPK